MTPTVLSARSRLPTASEPDSRTRCAGYSAGRVRARGPFENHGRLRPDGPPRRTLLDCWNHQGTKTPCKDRRNRSCMCISDFFVFLWLNVSAWTSAGTVKALESVRKPMERVGRAVSGSPQRPRPAIFWSQDRQVCATFGGSDHALPFSHTFLERLARRRHSCTARVAAAGPIFTRAR